MGTKNRENRQGRWIKETDVRRKGVRGKEMRQARIKGQGVSRGELDGTAISEGLQEPHPTPNPRAVSVKYLPPRWMIRR